MRDFEKCLFEPPGKRRLFWLLQAGGWGALCLLALAVLQSQEEILIQFVSFRLVFGFLISTFLLWPLLRRLRKRSNTNPLIALPSLFGIGVLFGCADAFGSHLVFRWIMHTQAGDVPNQLLMDLGFVFRSAIYILWITLYFSINNFIESTSNRLLLAQREIQTRECELRLLRAQVDPHFLFNSLNTILAVADEPQHVEEITHALADYLRFSLTQGSALHPLAEELDALESYLRVEKIRFEEQLEYSMVADERARRHPVPGALIQPLLENALKYGQRTRSSPLRVAIFAKCGDDGKLTITVTNSGHWVEKSKETSTGIGISNLRRRLELLYSANATLTIIAEPNEVRVVVVLPADSAPPLTTNKAIVPLTSTRFAPSQKGMEHA